MLPSHALTVEARRHARSLELFSEVPMDAGRDVGNRQPGPKCQRLAGDLFVMTQVDADQPGEPPSGPFEHVEADVVEDRHPHRRKVG